MYSLLGFQLLLSALLKHLYGRDLVTHLTGNDSVTHLSRRDFVTHLSWRDSVTRLSRRDLVTQAFISGSCSSPHDKIFFSIVSVSSFAAVDQSRNLFSEVK